MNEDKLERVYDHIEQGIEYTATVAHDGVVLGKITSYSADGLAEKLYKLEDSEKDYIVKTAADMLITGELELDCDELVKESKNESI